MTMTRLIWTLFLFVPMLQNLVACSDARGATNDPADECGVVVWVDATGDRVPGIVTQFGLANSSQNYVDGGGIIWTIDPESGAIEPVRGPREIYFESADCTGTAYVEAFIPRITFTTFGDPTIRVRPDNLASQQLSYGSLLDDTGCVPASATVSAVPADPTLPVPPITNPTLSCQFPLHVEICK